VTGNTDTACGEFGSLCMDCTQSGQFCSAQQCAAPTTCPDGGPFLARLGFAVRGRRISLILRAAGQSPAAPPAS